MEIHLTPKQSLALDYLDDSVSTEILYGGAAGGGKSFLGCLWLTWGALKYPNTRYLMGRAVLKNLKDSTLLTLFDVFKLCGLEADKHYTFNSQSNKISFMNGSEIYLKDLFQYPSDPEFDSLGSTEYTAAFIDEVSQVSEKAKNIVVSRLRYKTKELGLLPKLLMGTNPSKNFAYHQFYKLEKDGTLPTHRKFVRALPKDNPHLDPNYIENLKKLDEQSVKRLLFGDWEYDNDPSRLIDYEKIVDMWTNTPQPSNDKYIVCDVARFGSDKCVFYVWEGLHVAHATEFARSSTKETREKIEALAAQYAVPRSNIIVDEDGVGGGVKDEMSGIKGFVNNSSPINPPGKANVQNYSNLKSQCYYLLAEYINTGKISIYKEMPIAMREGLIVDLEQVKRKDADKDTKLTVVSKEQIKELIGRSPDYSDALMMRMYFEIHVQEKFHTARSLNFNF